ncbi:MAG: hypothetical protein ACTTJ9_09620 [Segatella oris]
MAFPHGGKQEIIENRLSLTGENKKSSKVGFPSQGKTRNHRKLAFPHEGKQEIIENRLSQHWETQNSAKIDFPNIGKLKIQQKLAFPTLGKQEFIENQLSQTWEEQKTPLAAFPNPRKDEKTPKVRRNNFRGPSLFCCALLFYNRSRMLICYSLPFQHKHR